MSSDDEEFNPDTLEAKDAKEEYDSDPSDTGTQTDVLIFSDLFLMYKNEICYLSSCCVELIKSRIEVHP